jgi:hypothetical protein
MTKLGRLAVLSGLAVAGTLTGAATYLGLVTGAVPLDLRVGRRTRSLGPLQVLIHAPETGCSR